MPMTDEQRATLTTWIKDHQPMHCPTCGPGHNVGVNPELLALVTFNSEKSALGPDGLAVVALSCDSCGQVRLFNAGKLGLID